MPNCPECEAELGSGDPGGLCPQCLILGAFESSVGADESGTRTIDALTSAAGADDFGRYHILRSLGEGGMGTVYLAEQLEPIRRRVALKVVKLGMDTAQVLARFHNERQALAMMDHPNIAQIFDAGATTKGRPYFVMEYIEGAPITQYCDGKRMSTKERLALFLAVCHGVQHAHQKGVIHRDLKPSNILLTEKDGAPIPKVIDFGIAKATDKWAIENTLLTEFGQIVGTPEYASPEQADTMTGVIDEASDVYSLGVLLYELLIGAVPFDTATLRNAGLAEMLRIIREDEAPSLSRKLTSMGAAVTDVAARRQTDPVSLRRLVDGDLNSITMKALEKPRARRYASVSELAADIQRHLEYRPVLASAPSRLYRACKFLRRRRLSALGTAAGIVLLAMSGVTAWSISHRDSTRPRLTDKDTLVLADFDNKNRATVAAAPRIESLAILPFRPMTGQNRDESLEFSMADSLTARLSATGQVNVRPTASMSLFPEVRPDPVTAGRRLNVDAVVDGTLQKMDGSLRVTARLIRVRDGALMWSTALDDSFAHLFDVQDSLARQIAGALSLRQSMVLTKRDTGDIEAWESYQKGRFFAGKRTPEGFQKAIGCYKDAIAKDANYVMAWSGLADAYMLSAGYFTAPVDPSHKLAREAAARAIALDPQSPEAHTSMALVHENAEWDFRESDKEYRRAIELNPNYATAQDWYGEFLVYMGRTAEGLAHLRRAEQTDPLSPNVGGDVAFALLNARRYDEAISEANKVLDMHPDFLRAHRALNIAYFWNRTWGLEEEELRRLSAYDAPGDAEAAAALFFCASGQNERAAQFVVKYRRTGARRGGPASREFMTAMFVLHDRLAAIDILEAGYAKHDAYMTSLKIGREFDTLRDDARFRSLIRRMKFLN